MKHTKHACTTLHLSNSNYNIMSATQLSKQYIQSAAWCSVRHLNQLCTSVWHAGRLANTGLVWFHRTWIPLPDIRIIIKCYTFTLPQLCISSNLHVETCMQETLNCMINFVAVWEIPLFGDTSLPSHQVAFLILSFEPLLCPA